MYSPKILYNSIDQMRRVGQLAYEPEEHSIAYSKHVAAHLDTLWDKETGSLTRELLKDEQQFIDNELLLSRLHYPYFIERYGVIYDFAREIIPFKHNIAQNFLLAIMCEMEEAEDPIMLQILKLRQLGLSSVIQRVMAHKALFYSNADVLCASYNENETFKLVNDHIGTTYKHLPWWMIKSWGISGQAKGKDLGFYESGDTYAEFLAHDTTRSKVSVQHGRMTSDLGRGTNPTSVHLCLHPATLIRVANGRLKTISSVTLEDTVITSFGESAKVKDVGISKRKPEEGVSIKFKGNPHRLEVSEDHPILSSDGWKEAGKLSLRDKVVFPTRNIQDIRREISTASRVRGWARARIPIEPIVRKYQLNKSFGWFIGMYLAEGSVDFNQASRDKERRPCRVILSVHQREVEYVVAQLQEVFPELNITVNFSRGSKTATIRINDNGLAEWVNTNIGHGKAKDFKDWFWQCCRGFCVGVVEGYIKGDGHVKLFPVNEIRATSVRESLIFGLRDMLASLKLGWSSVYFKAAGNHSGRECQDRWDLCITGSTARNLLKELGWASTIPQKNYLDSWEWDSEGRILIKVEEVKRKFIPEFWYLTVDHPLHDFATAQCTVKNTELPDYDDPAQSVESGLMNAIHENPFLFVALESTAKGKDWWYSFWKTNTELWPSRKTRFRPIFVPWYLGTDVWPTEGWLTPQRMRALAEYKPSPEALVHARKAKEYVQATPQLCAHLGSSWELPLHQLMFWEYSREYAIKRGGIKKWLQEIGAADAEECFQLTGESVFPYELIETYKSQCENPQECYMVESKEISSILTITSSSERLPDTSPVQVTKLGPSGVQFKSQLLPLRFTTETSPSARLLIWEPPQPGHKYTISYDDSEGIGKDSSAIEVIRHATWNSPAAQVAEWASNNYSAHDAWPVMLSVCEYYAKFMRPNDEPLAAIEIAVKGGTVQDEMRKRGYTKFYHRYGQTGGKPTFSGLGWKTSPGTRQILLDTFIKAIKDNWLIVKSKWLVEELEGLEVNALTRGIRVEAQRDYHDDRCLAIAIAFMCSMQDLAPTSLVHQADRLNDLKRMSSMSTHITPSMAKEDSSLISFGSMDIVAPTAQEAKVLWERMNSLATGYSDL